MKNNQAENIALRLNSITKTYGTGEYAVPALKGVNLNFRKSEFVSILGPSGCGKTTLLNIIGGLDRYTTGDLVIDGVSTKGYGDKDWDAYRNNSIGFVFQTYNLIPHQTVLGNVELAMELSGVSKSERRERALAILKKVGLEGLEHKKPNQMSGGQMQRVAIARALVNDPEIVLADEPTGALDTQTSVQIMDLLKDIAKDKLVIMVTHNPQLAERYSTRIIKLLDGLVVDDSNPLNDFVENISVKKKRKPKMGFKTAFLLSLKNLFSKRTRTILTSVAGSIGITGVALVLALSNGFNAYMARMQTDSLASYPLTISENSIDMSSFNTLYETELKEKYPELDNVLVHEAFKNLVGMLKSNDLSDTSDAGFLAHMQNLPRDSYYSINYQYGFSMNDYLFTKTTVNGEEKFSSVDDVTDIIGKAFEGKLTEAMGGMMSTSMVADMIPTFQEMPSRELVLDQYELLYGKWPTFEKQDYNQVVLVVDQFNGVSDITAMLLGYVSGEYDEQTNEFSFDIPEQGIELEKMVGENAKGFYLANNQMMFTTPVAIPNMDAKVSSLKEITVETDGLEKIDVVGIIRMKEGVSGLLESGIAYTPALTERILEVNLNSEIAQNARENSYVAVVNPNASMGFEGFTARMLAGVNTPLSITIYAKDFDSKYLIKEHIDSWNANYEEDDQKYVHYSDMMNDMFSMLNTMVDAVTYVLVAFTSISLVVSSVMIGIITYISVVERTKEIGVLRSLGASKREISSVFNAETIIIGSFAGLLGVGVTYLLCIPINAILINLVPAVGRLAVLSPVSAIILVLISVGLTLISGLIPSGVAAKKDPVVALRSE